MKKLSVIGQKCERKIGIVWTKNRYMSPAANEFKDFLISYFKGDEQ